MRGYSCPNFESCSLNMSNISEWLLPTNCLGRRRFPSDGQIQKGKKTSHRPKLRAVQHWTRSGLHGADRKTTPKSDLQRPSVETYLHLSFLLLLHPSRRCHKGCRLVMSFIPPDDYSGHLACSSIPDNIEQGELWHKRLRVSGWQDSNGSNTRLIVMLATRCKKKSSGLVLMESLRSTHLKTEVACSACPTLDGSKLSLSNPRRSKRRQRGRASKKSLCI
jgi:hypothetical protein